MILIPLVEGVVISWAYTRSGVKISAQVPDDVAGQWAVLARRAGLTLRDALVQSIIDFNPSLPRDHVESMATALSEGAARSTSHPGSSDA